MNSKKMTQKTNEMLYRLEILGLSKFYLFKESFIIIT
jgi:hypothetical protein